MKGTHVLAFVFFQFILVLVELSNIQWVQQPEVSNFKSENNFIELIRTSNSSLETCAVLASEREGSSFAFNTITGECIVSKVLFLTTISLKREVGFIHYEIFNETCPIADCFHIFQPHYLCLFVYIEEGHDYFESEAMCEAINGTLPILDSVGKNNVLGDYINTFFPENVTEFSVFLGAQKSQEGRRFIWNSGLPLPSQDGFWKEKTYPINGDCVTLFTDRIAPRSPFWKTQPCSWQSSAVVCEKRAITENIPPK